jgi:hypothetical protein
MFLWSCQHERAMKASTTQLSKECHESSEAKTLGHPWIKKSSIQRLGTAPPITQVK